MDLRSYLEKNVAVIDEALALLLPAQNTYPQIIHEAVSYSMFAGGKRLRPILCLASAEAIGKESTAIIPVACALEMIHTYSLIHDDLPAMDNDDYRRGKLTNHKVFGEGIAVLAGDALLTQAFEVLASYGLSVKDKDKSAVMCVINEIAQASGSQGMVGGQSVDLKSEGKSIDEATLTYIHRHKTGALFRASIRSGAILSQASKEQLHAFTIYAENFGLAFQITDDLLDIVGNSQKLGKPVGSDLRNEKVTFPSIYGLDKSKWMAVQTVEKAVEALRYLPGNTEPLKLLVEYLLKRET
ncbi:MAG: geranyl transferase [Firmicutes bacterium HGW-Firmicutes-12]|nr:MAG: geranyl transferase [Firmicutes bacterium HGW-Firmicutes-12]